MKRLYILPFILTACALAAVYAALTEQFSIQTIAIGFVVSAFVLYLSQSFFLKTRMVPVRFPVFRFFVFAACLVCEIFKGSWTTFLSLFDTHADVKLIQYKTALKSDGLKCLLANAITLTPGTVTAEICGDVFEVLKLCALHEDDHTASLKKMEKLLLRMERTEA